MTGFYKPKTNQEQRTRAVVDLAEAVALREGFDLDAIALDVTKPMTVRDLIAYLAIGRALSGHLSGAEVEVLEAYRQQAWDSFALGGVVIKWGPEVSEGETE